MHHEVSRWMDTEKFIQKVFLCLMGKVNSDRGCEKNYEVCVHFLLLWTLTLSKRENISLGAALGSMIIHLGTWLMAYRPVQISRLHSHPRPLCKIFFHRFLPPESLWEILNMPSSFLPLFLTMSVISLVFPSITGSILVGFSFTWKSESEAVCSWARGSHVSLEPGEKNHLVYMNLSFRQ